MRVAIVTENFLPKLDGVTRTITMLLEQLQAQQHQSIVFGPKNAPLRYAGARIVPIDGIPIPFYKELRFLFPRRRDGYRLARFQPDIVHLADPMMLGMTGLYWAQRISVPVVAAYHTNLSDYIAHYGLGALKEATWTYRRFLHNQCAATLCPSPSTAKILREHGFERVHLWPRGVDSVLFTPERRSTAYRATLQATDATRLLLYVGRLSHEKNIMYLAHAFRTLADEQTRLVIVGDGPARLELEAAMQGLPVIFTGYQTGEELARIYAAADMFLFPSTTETFGQVVQEAMASGLPVIGANAEGVCDLVQDGVTGILTKPSNSTDFTAAVHSLLGDPTRSQAMGQAARVWAEQRTWAEVMSNLFTLYQEIIQGPMIPLDPELVPAILEELIPA